MTDALRLRGVTKRYTGHTAVDGLDLVVPRETIYGILGPNGAGKSTTLRMVMNILARDAGDIELLGVDPARDRRVLRRVGYLPEERGLYRKMKVLDVIEFFARLKGVERRAARRDGARWLERMGLGEWSDTKVEALSKGMQQKVQFITTVLHRPDVLILDEPQSGLDPMNQEVLRETILEARDEGRTVVFSTHNMEQAESTCESVCIIAAGRKVLDGPVRELRRANRGNRWAVEFDARSEAAERALREDGRFSDLTRDGEGWAFDLREDADVGEVMLELARLDVPLIRFERVHPSLHEIFVRHVGDATRPARRAREVAHV